MKAPYLATHCSTPTGLGGQAADPLKSHARFLRAPSRRRIVSKGKGKYTCALRNESFRTAPIIKDVAAPVDSLSSQAVSPPWCKFPSAIIYTSCQMQRIVNARREKFALFEGNQPQQEFKRHDTEVERPRTQLHLLKVAEEDFERTLAETMLSTSWRLAAPPRALGERPRDRHLPG
jgi:hypothetical protein